MDQPTLPEFSFSGLYLSSPLLGAYFYGENVQVIFLSVPWDVTASYLSGTSGGPNNILELPLN